jgi:Tol biopolymer transport system component
MDLRLTLNKIAGLTITAIIIVIVIASTSPLQAQANEERFPSEADLNAYWILDYNKMLGKTLYLAASEKGKIFEHLYGSNIVLADSHTGEMRIIAEKSVSAKLSPDGTLVVVRNDKDEIHLLTVEGKEITRVGVHGGSPIFSHDGKYVAYHKLADEGDDSFSRHEASPYGIALYSLATGEEKLITSNKNDYRPVGFSADMSKLYFNSTREYPARPYGIANHVASLWVVDLNTRETTRLTNVDEEVVRQGTLVPVIDKLALWSSDRKTVISSADAESGVWKFIFNEQGRLASAEHIADGTSPRWQVPDKSIIIRSQVNKGVWKIIDINNTYENKAHERAF